VGSIPTVVKEFFFTSCGRPFPFQGQRLGPSCLKGEQRYPPDKSLSSG
jgi:hypothetical protein